MIQNEWMTSRDCELDLHRLVDRQVQRRQLADRRRPSRRSAAWTPIVQTVSSVGLAVVLEVPRPLLADRGDRDIRVVVLRLEDRLVTRREGEEADHEDERHDRVEDLDRHVVAQLHREADLALAAPVDDRRPAHQTPRDDADDEQDDPGVDPETRHHLGVVRGRRAALVEAREGTRSARSACSRRGRRPLRSRRGEGPSGDGVSRARCTFLGRDI